jgi:phosphatidylglycerol:prolipoprotein diacylglycerol transferase
MGPYTFPEIDPIALQIGPIAIRWYALAYIAGLFGGWQYCLRLAKRPPNIVTPMQIDDFVLWATVGVILGGRLGFVAFYQPSYYLSHPSEIFQIWKGGMSFHGGLLGVIVAMFWFSRRRGLPFFAFSDIIAVGTPIGLFFGRLANFMNGELWGRVTDVSWGVIFPSPRAGPFPRHPSQLYEAALEGAVLFAVLTVLLYRFRAIRRVGVLSGVFLVGYGIARVIVETVREPDDYVGFLPFGTTLGQWLTVPMVAAGVYFIWSALRGSESSSRGDREPARTPDR